MASTTGKTPRKTTKTSTPAKPRTKAGAATGAMLDELAERLRESILPGDTPLAAERAREAAAFLLETATTRTADDAGIALQSASEERRYMRIALVNRDMPFLVDSVAATIAAHGLAIDRLIHPVVPIERSAAGALTAIPSTDEDDADYESMIYIETQRVDARTRRDIERALRTTLADVRAAVADWQAMRAAMRDDANRMADPEPAQLLSWLEQGALTLLGHLTRDRDGRQSEALGICRKSAKSLLADVTYDRAFAWFDQRGIEAAPLIIKANLTSNVHRRVPLDLFLIPIMEGKKVSALSVHAGVWTSAALATPPQQVPVLRKSLAHLLDALDLDAGGHTGKSLVHALTALPHDLIIGFEPADLERVTTAMMSLVDRPRPRLALVESPLSRHLFAFVWLPRDLISTEVRQRITERLAEASGSEVLEWSLLVEGGNIAMLRFVFDIRDGGSIPDEAALNTEITEMLRGWGEAVETELAAGMEPGRAAAIAGRYAEAFPLAYRSRYGAHEAARDIDRLRTLASHEGAEDACHRAVRLYRLDSDAPGHLRLKIYQHEGVLPLSDAVPALENFGFRVLQEQPTKLDEGRLGTVHDFELELPAGEDTAPLLERGAAIEQAIAAVLNANAEDDSFNRLVVSTGLAAREAEWLRAFYRYLRQTGLGYTIYTVVDALARAPQVTRPIIDLFVALHDPAFAGNRDEAANAAREAIRTGLGKVAAINDDRLLRLYHALVEAMLRTNAFAPAAAEALAFKFDSAKVPGLPRPLPWREMFVYSRRVEGIHLRAGPIARGGLRWSDRRDDFRTEILGLMKAQRVKNAVIVPTGAKGGFYPKQLPDPARDREAWAAEGKASYQLFIRSLLSITDNIVKDRVVHPEAVVVHDGPDPYFVVAADKGTASFSDTANAIAEERGFWLDDAFASGGSNGYDHKAMGITARGAWISVQRHFSELGIDIQREPVTVAGCGDMSGDVFGNGMLLSKAIKLVAAFDHRHIFIDPAPDPAASWQERKRLFDLPRSSWDDYNKALISKGGGVWSRTQKTIKLPPATKKLLGLDQAEIEPDALISAILKAPVELLWFGGIGTYIRSSSETNPQVGDPANDALRVAGEEVRARVIGEGANLGVTQAGRIEFALRGAGGVGGRINTDFIDNSAGVNCSDNEVNIKIALAAARRAGKLSEKARNTLLESMTEEVAELVLDDNRKQPLALSIAERGGAGAMAAQVQLIETLEESGALDRATEGLAPSDVLRRRAGDSVGLTRPELAVLLSSTKLVLQAAFEASTLPDDPLLEPALMTSFPTRMQAKFAKQIREHQLRREIISTVLSNRIINRMGMVHPFELAEEEGAALDHVGMAFVAADALYGINPLWDEIETAPMPEDARLALFDRLAVAMRNHMADLLRAGVGTRGASVVVAELGKAVAGLADRTGELLASESRAQSEALSQELVALGAPEKIAARVVHLFDLDGAVGVARLAQDTGMAARTLTGAFTDLGARMGLDWAQGTAALMNPSDVWERLLVAGLARDFQQMRLDFLRRLARRRGFKDDPLAVVAAWAADHEAGLRQFRSVIGRAQQGRVQPAMLAQIASQARNLLGQ